MLLGAAENPFHLEVASVKSPRHHEELGTASVGCWASSAKRHHCSRSLVHLGLIFPRQAIRGLNLSGSFLSFCNAVIPGSHPEEDGQSHMGNQREEVASFISHMSQGRGKAWPRFCFLDSWSSTTLLSWKSPSWGLRGFRARLLAARKG